MLRYIATVCDETIEHRRCYANLLRDQLLATAGGWVESFTTTGLRVFTIGARPLAFETCRLPNQFGVLLGTVFQRTATTESVLNTAFSAAESSAIIETDGRRLITHYWGNYIAFLRFPQSRVTRVLRSPLGSLPCLRIESHGMHVYVSYMPDLEMLGISNLSVNWDYLHRMLGKVPHGMQTALNEVTDVSAGQCDEIQANGKLVRVVYWDAMALANAEPPRNFREAVDETRSTMRGCIHAWASRYERIMLRLSGGLDSSGLLAFLSEAPSRPKLLAANRYSHGHKEDEREFARLAATAYGCELLELKRDPSFRLNEVFDARPTERPLEYLGQLGLGRAEAVLARARSIDSVFTGMFGDQLFYAGNYELSAADYMYQFGLGLEFWRVSLSAARVAQCSLWSVLRKAVHLGVGRHRFDPLTTSRRMMGLLHVEAIDKIKRYEPSEMPWWAPPTYVPPGKQFHISTLYQPEQCYGTFYDPQDPDPVTPLMSQPLVELCLRIPIYFHTRNGWDREVERCALAPVLPPELLRRRSKGGQSSYTAEVVRRNLPLTRELLLEGGLLKEGILDRNKVEAALTTQPTKQVIGTARLSRCINIEVWLRLWQRSQLRAAA